MTGIGYAPEGDVAPCRRRIEAGPLRTRTSSKATIAAATLANNAPLVHREGRWTVAGDPTEGALKVLAREGRRSNPRSHARFPRVGEIPFSSERR